MPYTLFLNSSQYRLLGAVTQLCPVLEKVEKITDFANETYITPSHIVTRKSQNC